MTSIYNLRQHNIGTYTMAKFDAKTFVVEAIYTLVPKNGGYTCDCPANNRTVILKPCKHKRMMPLMLGAVNTNRFYEPEGRTWCEPLAGPEAEYADPVASEASEVGLDGSASFEEAMLESGQLLDTRREPVIEPPIAAQPPAPTIRRR